jgi:hypothetical protein
MWNDILQKYVKMPDNATFLTNIIKNVEVVSMWRAVVNTLKNLLMLT